GRGAARRRGRGGRGRRLGTAAIPPCRPRARPGGHPAAGGAGAGRAGTVPGRRWRRPRTAGRRHRGPSGGRVSGAAWRRRFRAARVSLPAWHLDSPQRACYATNASGVWQLVSWDLDADRHTTLTDKPTGVMSGQPLPDGSGVVWFDDHAGDEVGRYVVTPFAGGAPRPLLEDLDEGWSAGLSLRRGRSAVGLAGRDGFQICVADDTATRVVYRHRQPAAVGGLSRDAALLAISHTEHGDTIHPALRVVDPHDGADLAEAWDGAGNTLSPAA